MTLLKKPPYGSPCNGCGVCCLLEQCNLSIAVFGQKEICPALEIDRDSRVSQCGLVADPAAHIPPNEGFTFEHLSEALALMLGAGAGCDGQTADEPEPTEEQRQSVRAKGKAALETASPEARAIYSYLTEVSA